MIDKQNNTIKFAVISDLHVYDKEIADYNNNPPSYFSITDDELSNGDSPGYDLYDLIGGRGENEKIIVDYLLCPGDIGEKGNPKHVKYSWDYINRLADKLEAKKIFISTGNHDLDSRYNYNEYDAKGLLLSLTPHYPTGDINKKNEYWANNYLLIEEPEFNVLILNSAAFHGVAGKINDLVFDEYAYGRVSEYTIKSIVSRLKEINKKDINILLCHHHPKKNDEIKVKDYSEMKGGGELLVALAKANCGGWLVVHGHRHYPIISYAEGVSDSPIIFSAGSFSACLYKEIQTQAKNQFYILEFDLDDTRKYGMVGNFKSWTWVKGKGWYQPDDMLGIPSYGGFGLRLNVKTTVDKIIKMLNERSEYVSWEELLDALPEAKYYMPRDIENIAVHLQENGVECLRTEKSVLTQMRLSDGYKK